MKIEQIERNYLEIKSLRELLEVTKPNTENLVSIVNPPDFQINKFFYKQIGNKYSCKKTRYFNKWRKRIQSVNKYWIKWWPRSTTFTFSFIWW